MQPKSTPPKASTNWLVTIGQKPDIEKQGRLMIYCRLVSEQRHLSFVKIQTIVLFSE